MNDHYFIIELHITLTYLIRKMSN